MSIHNRRPLKRIRRKLRHALTPAEATLWLHLRRSQIGGHKFRRQHSIGPYIVDYYCPAARTVLELDGATHDNPCAQARDAERDRYFECLGLRVIRVRSLDVIRNTDDVITYLVRVLGEK